MSKEISLVALKNGLRFAKSIHNKPDSRDASVAAKYVFSVNKQAAVQMVKGGLYAPAFPTDAKALSLGNNVAFFSSKTEEKLKADETPVDKTKKKTEKIVASKVVGVPKTELKKKKKK